MFSKILIFACKCQFYHWQQIPSVLFLWSDRLTSFILEKVSARYCSHIWSRILQVKPVFHEKAPSVAHNSNAWVLFLKTTFIFITQQKLCSLHFATQVKCSQGLKLNTINNFYCIIKDILKWNWLFFFLTRSAWWWRTQWPPELRQWHHRLVPLRWLPLLLHHQCQSSTVTNANNFSLLLWK